MERLEEDLQANSSEVAATVLNSMSNLMRLWKSRVMAIVGIVRAGETEHREVANIAAQIGADYHGRFIVELLQNASDQAADGGLRDSSVTIVRASEFVAIANEGTPFDDKGLRSITSLGLSTDRKSTRLNSSHVAISYAVFCLKKKIK